MKPRTKNSYKGEFNWYGETLTLYTSAKGEDQVLNQFINKLSKIVRYNQSAVRRYLVCQARNSYTITKLKEKHQ
jgi:hypothetical protein